MSDIEVILICLVVINSVILYIALCCCCFDTKSKDISKHSSNIITIQKSLKLNSSKIETITKQLKDFCILTDQIINSNNNSFRQLDSQNKKLNKLTEDLKILRLRFENSPDSKSKISVGKKSESSLSLTKIAK